MGGAGREGYVQFFGAADGRPFFTPGVAVIGYGFAGRAVIGNNDIAKIFNAALEINRVPWLQTVVASAICRVWVPGGMLPGRLFRYTVIRILTGLKIDVNIRPKGYAGK
ncbi:hypothetical protein [Sneathiella sp.]|uniref:hypothetical protein n=1 Tax=Sneathiella sp. TaxID=1964365 RepID=UPI00356515BE